MVQSLLNSPSEDYIGDFIIESKEKNMYRLLLISIIGILWMIWLKNQSLLFLRFAFKRNGKIYAIINEKRRGHWQIFACD